MHALRPTRHLARLVLAWFVLALGSAMASPLIKPHSWQMVCSASGVVKLLSVDDNGVAIAVGHQIECPLCLLVNAPPPAHSRVLSVQPVSDVARPSIGMRYVVSCAAPPLPARGPPRFS